MRENAQIKLGGFFGIVTEPEEWRNFVHGLHGTSQEVTSSVPKVGASRDRCGLNHG
jgi:hypothetical protein